MANIGVSGGNVTYANTIGGTGLTTGGVTTAHQQDRRRAC